MTVFQVGQLHTIQGIGYELVMLFAETGKETLRLVESGEHHFVYRDGKLLVEVVVLWQVAHGDFLHRLAVLIVADVPLCGVHQSENKTHEGCLSATIRSDNTQIVVLIDGEVDIVEYFLAFVACCEVLDFYDWIHVVLCL